MPNQFCGRTRREFLWQFGAGFGGVALSAMLQADGFFGRATAADATSTDSLAPKPPHFPTKAKRCIFLFMYGGPSQMDLFDYKPVLQKMDGKTADIEVRRRAVTKGKLLASKRKFAQYGKSGQWCSDALPHISQHMDELAVVKSLYSDSFIHGSAMLQMNSGRIVQGHPSIGSWLGYGLGSMNRNLPGYVVMLDPRGGPISGATNWSAGFMPAAYQGTVLRSAGEPILNLGSTAGDTVLQQRDRVDAINALNAAHLSSRPGYSELQARVASYELAFQLQSTAPEALDLSREDEKTKEMYGLNDPKGSHTLTVGPAPFGRQCLIARRMIERGVRFVQIYHGGGHQQQNWDAHNGVEENLAIHCPEIDKPIAGLLTDLKRRGLLDDTLVVWGGEFGRQPVVQGSGDGRDHNPKGFTYWLAGGGVKGGTSYGETDELGHEAVVDRHHVRDLHATLLHLMGLDHHKLTYFYGGLNQKLTGVIEPEVIKGIIA
ncbi:DUF1501 domain-containing protein [Fimbriiglobus ruber]|uniref:Sulfatase n=1 Tax=Fimbriiglobus ruber TaxID=1908690 RepID=A0A225EEF9_9BACT|nr:DUF1501 domain-containing protein [Fimbriiglobus ruber]OWK46755.1 hypothetical protein FRUB_00454 [Fimbriiglobus ruber]